MPAVVVTGCDTGFGRGTAEKLYKDGYYVVAACLTDGAAKELNGVFGSKCVSVACGFGRVMSVCVCGG